MSDLDFSQIDLLEASLGEIAAGGGVFAHKAVEVSARNVKDGWTKGLEGSETLPGAARAIEYRVFGGNAIRGSEIWAEIAPRLGKQGSLVFVPELGSLNTAPRGHGRAALVAEAQGFADGLLRASEDAEKAAGL
jgi:hypothetical protein